MTLLKGFATICYMPTKIAIGFSQLPDAKEAVFQASVMAKNQLNTSHTDLVVVFASFAYATEENLNIIHTTLQPKRLIGSTTAAIITSDGVFDQGISILAIVSDEISFGIACNEPAKFQDPRTAGFDWGRKLNTDFKNTQHHGCLLLCDPSLPAPVEFIRGVQEVLGSGFPSIGAISSDNFKYTHIAQLFQRQVKPQSVVGLMIGGARIIYASSHGYKPLGKPRHITRAQDNIIQLIDNQPAVNIYKEFLGPQADALTQKTMLPQNILYPLGIYSEELGKYQIKKAVDILPDGSIVTHGDVAQGSEVHLMIGNRDSCKNSTTDVATKIKDALGGRQAKLLLIIEGALRQKILRQHSFIEIQTIKEILGYTTPLIGLSTFGEIIPMGAEGNYRSAQVQNQTISIIAVD